MDDKITERVRKLMAKAEGTDNEHEADAFMAQAVRLMQRHSLDEAAVRAGMGQDARPPEIVKGAWSYSNADGLGLVRGSAASDIAKVFGCSCLIRNHPHPSVPWDVVMYGTEQAIDAATLVITSLSLQWEAAAVRAWDARAEQVREKIRAERAYYGYQEYRPPYSAIPVPGAYGYNPFNAQGRQGPSMRDALGRSNPYDAYRPGPVLTPYQEEMENLIRNSGLPTFSANELRRQFNIPVPGEGPDRADPGAALAEQLSPEHTQQFMESYITGYVSRAVERLKGTQTEMEAEVPGAGLVLKADHDRAQEARDRDFPNLSAAGSRQMDYGAYAAGQQGGSGADIGGTRFGYGADRAPRGIGSGA